MNSYHKNQKGNVMNGCIFLRTIFLSLFVLQNVHTENSDLLDVYTSSPDYTIQVKFNALYVKPGATNTHFAAEAFPLPVLSPNWQIHDIAKTYHFGFDVYFGAQIHSVNTSLFGNWQHFKNCNRTVYVTDSDNMVGPFFEIGPDASPYYQTEGTVHFSFNEINIDYGQNVNLGDRLTMTWFVGASVLQLCEFLDYTYTGTQEDEVVSRNIATPIKFTGAGPQFGAQFLYDIICGFGLSGKVAGAILNGTSKTHTTYTSYSPILETLDAADPNIQTTKVNCISLTVPSLFTRLGVSYLYEFEKYYAMQFEAGYQAQIYFNVLQSIDMGSEVVTPPVETSSVGVYARTFQRNFSSFSLSGAYFSFGFYF